MVERRTNLPYAQSFRELIVYQRARALAQRIFETTGRFPREEAFSLTDQIRRSSRAVGAQIAEAWAKRRYERHFVSKLTDADAEQQETQHWLEIARDCGYVTAVETQEMLQQCAEIGRMLHSMIAKADLFCNPDSSTTLRETTPLYFTTDDQSPDH